MDNEYYILDGGERIGPFTTRELMNRPLEPGDMILLPSQTQGTPAHNIPEFTDYFKSEGIYYPTAKNTASYFLRLPAFIIDYLILVIGVIVVMMVFFPQILVQLQPSDAKGAFDYEKIVANMAQHQTAFLVLHIGLFIITVLYHATCESSTLRGSVGKYAMGLAVVDELGYGVTFWQAFKRNLGKIIYEVVSMAIGIFAYFGYLRMIWGERHQAMHDMITGSFIVKKND